VRASIEVGALHPYISIRDCGRYADAEVRKWLGLKSWKESWGSTPRIRAALGFWVSDFGQNICHGFVSGLFLV